MMDGSGGWLARVARRFGELVGGTRYGNVDVPVEEQRFWAPDPPVQRPDDPSDPSDVRIDANGRYVAGGYSFSTPAQARDHLTRRATLAVAVPAPPATIRPGPATPTREGPRWVPNTQRLSVGTRTIDAEMIYYGTPLRHDPQHDQSRIDPALRIDPRGDPSGATLNYWPSYQSLDPRARSTYLDWITNGRADSTVPIGYVFVFFYGLEQRLLLDDARDEAPAIFAEVRRLLQLHGDNHSFRGYASRLLALSALYEDEDDAPPKARGDSYELEIPLDVRVRLGRRLRDGKPFDADDALHWVLSLPDVYLRTPGQRCFDELRALWRTRFDGRHPGGLTIRRPKKMLRHEYRAASGKFSADINVGELPDVAGVTAPLTGLRALLDLCLDDLSAFSRYIGRDPDARGRLRADLLLPVELRDCSASLRACREQLVMMASGGATVVRADDLARTLDIEIGTEVEKLPAPVVRQIGAALDAMHHGCEPDRRYGPASSLRAAAAVSIFAWNDGGAVDHERPAYASARTMVEIATLASASDGEVVAAELDAIERRLRALPDLADHEIARLLACARALAADPPKVRAALKRLGEVPPAQRTALAASAVEAVLADGTVQPGEVKFLEALHSTLGLPASALYAALHRGAEDAGPVLVTAGEDETTIPFPAEPSTGFAVPIDAARLERIRSETTRVSALLSSIFVEEELEAAPPPPRPVATSGPFSGLDAPHSELLSKLVEGPMDRADFDVTASALRLLPDGAIEAINEWGFDRFGEPVIDDDGSVRIVPELMSELMPRGVDA